MNETTRPCVTCDEAISASFAHCNYCGASQEVRHAHATASGHQGIAIAGQSGQINISQGSSWDTRPTSAHEKGGARLVSKGFELAANIVTVLSFLAAIGAFTLAQSGATGMIPTGIMALLTVASVCIAAPFLIARTQGWAVVRMGSLVFGVLRKREDSGRLEWIDPKLKCPLCPLQSSLGAMSLQHFENKTWWICAANARDHRLVFDGTQYVD